MKNWIKSHYSFIVVTILVWAVVLGGTIVYAAIVANSTVTGTITVSPYTGGGGGGGGGGATYSATATPVVFSGTFTAASSGNATVDIPATITVTDTSTGGHLTSVSNVIGMSGTLPTGLSVTCTNAAPVAFDTTAHTATLNVKISGTLTAGTYNLADGSPVIALSVN